jgi:sporulation protein YlmC with PRC-barrel domain
MEIPLDARVECQDGLCGRSKFLLVDPCTEKITHVVVKEDSTRKEFIVPLEMISDTVGGKIQMQGSKAELKNLCPFIETRYIEEKVDNKVFAFGGGTYGNGAVYYHPNVTPLVGEVPVEDRQLPEGESAIFRGTRVEAKDGYIGRVDEFVVNPKSGHITSLVMREGHLWGRRDVIIPVSAIKEANEQTVILKLDKKKIEALPTYPLRRRWG